MSEGNCYTDTHCDFSGRQFGDEGTPKARFHNYWKITTKSEKKHTSIYHKHAKKLKENIDGIENKLTTLLIVLIPSLTSLTAILSQPVLIEQYRMTGICLSYFRKNDL
ncbi:hypothetical protein TcasGA2_TC014332 [Tribolium castaneum]|uniref:Uncharacterized protein n=1 Tax=Tribolium castaneum TaxID=7070 RepID=D6WLD5_TRICA|nr:hypothetical protein TcasGA2_TC014332 [Tribolium castaneum]